MPQLDSDSFTYSNGNLATVSSAKWTKTTDYADMVVDTNAIKGVGDDCSGIITSWSGSTTNQYSQVTVVIRIGDDGGPAVRMNDEGDGYHLHVGGAGNSALYKRTNNAFAQIAAAIYGVANGDIVYIEMQGNVITCHLNADNTYIVYTDNDTPIASGKPGVRGYSATTRLDSWLAGDFGSPATAVGPLVGGMLTESHLINGRLTP